MKTFKIEMCRISYAFRTFTINAKSEIEAKLDALENAGDYEYSESSSDYLIDDIREVEDE
jgi:hypothetical protein